MRILLEMLVLIIFVIDLSRVLASEG